MTGARTVQGALYLTPVSNISKLILNQVYVSKRKLHVTNNYYFTIKISLELKMLLAIFWKNKILVGWSTWSLYLISQIIMFESALLNKDATTADFFLSRVFLNQSNY